jgi:hypothetical protein
VIWFTKKGYTSRAYASGVLWNIRVNLSAAVSAHLRCVGLPRGPHELRVLSTGAGSSVTASAISWGGSGSEAIDDQAYEPVMPNPVADLPERIAAHGDRAP